MKPTRYDFKLLFTVIGIAFVVLSLAAINKIQSIWKES